MGLGATSGAAVAQMTYNMTKVCPQKYCMNDFMNVLVNACYYIPVTTMIALQTMKQLVAFTDPQVDGPSQGRTLG